VKRFVARMDLPESHPQAMTENDGRARGGRFEYHDVIDTKTNKIAFRDDGNIDGGMCRRIAAALNKGGTVKKTCDHCGHLAIK
jgi:hypothetical protein